MRLPFCKILLLATGAACAVNASANDEVKATALLAGVQVRSQQLALLADDAVDGKVDAFLDLGNVRDRIDVALTQLKRGDPGSGFSGLAGHEPLNADLLGIDKAWAALDADVKKILQGQRQIIESAQAEHEFASAALELNSRTDEVVKALVDGNGTKLQVKLASYQIVLVDRMLRRIHSVLQGGEDSEKAVAGLQRDEAFYGAVLTSLVQGNPDLDLKAMDNAAARDILQGMSKQWEGLAPTLSELLDAAPTLKEARQAADGLRRGSEALLEKSAPLQRHIGG